MNVSQNTRKACIEELLENPEADVDALARQYKLSPELIQTIIKAIDDYKKDHPSERPTAAVLRQYEREFEEKAKKLLLAGLNTTQVRELTSLTANRCVHLKEEIIEEARTRYSHDKASLERLEFVQKNRVRGECTGFLYQVLASLFVHAYRAHSDSDQPIIEEVAAAYKTTEQQFKALDLDQFAKEGEILPFTLSDALQIAKDMHLRDRAAIDEAATTVVTCRKCGCDYVLFTKIPGRKGCPICKLLELIAKDDRKGK